MDTYGNKGNVVVRKAAKYKVSTMLQAVNADKERDDTEFKKNTDSRAYVATVFSKRLWI